MTAMSIPLLRDKADAWRYWMQEECLGSRRQEFDEFNARLGLTRHRAWLAENPTGPVVIVVLEGPGAGTFLQKLATATEPFDVWFRQQVESMHGFDFSELAEIRPSELVLDWQPPVYAEIAS